MDSPANPSLSAILEAVRVETCSTRSVLEEEVVQLFNEFRNPLLRYLMTFRLSPQDGEEIVQEVFLALFEHLRRGKSRANLRGWIFRVGHNLALKQRIRDGRKSQLQCDEEIGASQIAPGPNPEEEFSAIQRRQRMMAVVRTLPEQDRNCLCLRAEGLRYREIAEVLGISLGAVSLALGRSLARLSQAGGE